MNNASLRLNVTIDLVRADENGVVNPSYRTITLTDNTDYAALGIPLSQLTGYFIVIDPVGNIIHQGDFTTPDITHIVSTSFSGVQVPLDAFNKPLGGTYSFQMFVKRTTLSTAVEYNTNVLTFNFCMDGCKSCTKPTIEILFDCNVATASGYDRTVYKSNASVEKRLTLVPPVGSKFIDGSDAASVVSSTSQVTSNALWTGLWQLLLRSVVTETTVTGSLTVEFIYSLEKSTTGQAACNINVCGLFKCIDNRFKELELVASQKGGVANNIVLADGFIQIITLLNKFQIARECGKITQAQKYYSKLKEILGCDCGCSESGLPEFVYPLVAPAGSNVLVQGSQYVAVTSQTVGNTTVYTVAISAQLASLINQIKTYTVQSPDSSISVNTTVTGSSVLFDISVETAVVDQLLGDEVDASCLSLGGSRLTAIVQELVDRACAGSLPPVAEDDILICSYETPNSVLVTANDFFTSNVVVTITTPPANGTAVVLGDNKTIEYTPDSAFSGNDVLTYTITDQDGQTSSADLNITVNPVVGVSCAVISAGFVAGLSIQSGALQIVLTNITDYLTNIPTSCSYQIQIRDSSNNVLETYTVAGNNNSVAQVFVSPDTPLSTWNNVRIVQTIVTEDTIGNTCGTITSTNTYTVPNITSSIFAGVTVTCLGVSSSDPDTTIMQAIVDKACASLTEVETENGISGDGKTGTPVKLGGALTENTTIAGNFSLTKQLAAKVLQRIVTTYAAGRFNFAEDSTEVAAVPAIGATRISHEDRATFAFNGVTVDTTAREIYLANRIAQLLVGGDLGVVNSPTNLAGQRVYGIVNEFIAQSITSDNVDIDIERLIAVQIDALFGGGQSGTVAVDEFIQLFLRDQDSGSSPGEFILAANRYAIYQEGANDDSFFAGVVTFDQPAVGTIVAPSDERIKDVEGDFEKGLDAINALKVVKYAIKEQYGGSKGKIGVIAQEAEKVLPEAVKVSRNPKYKDIEDFRVVNNDAILFTLVNAVKELSAQVGDLKKELAELKK